MSISENKEFVRRYLEAISGKPKTDAVLDLFMTDESLKEHIAAAEAGLPLYRLDAEEIIAEGDVVFNIFVNYRIANGKIVDHWMLTDNMALLTQIGAIPAPA
jgi:hypothetical protein